MNKNIIKTDRKPIKLKLNLVINKVNWYDFCKKNSENSDYNRYESYNKRFPL